MFRIERIQITPPKKLENRKREQIFSIFTPASENSLDEDSIDYNLINNIVRSVSNEYELPAKQGQCFLTAEAAARCFADLGKNPDFTMVVQLVGNSGLFDYCGKKHTVPIVYHQGQCYLFDFFNFYDKDAANSITSVLIFSPNRCFEKVVELTGCQASSSSITWTQEANNREWSQKSIFFSDHSAIEKFLSGSRLQKSGKPNDDEPIFADCYHPNHAGKVVIYSCLFAETRALLSLKRKPFANLRAYWNDKNGKCKLFANTRALLQGKRPLFANTISTIKTLFR